MRILGLDYGANHIGVALSDELLLLASPLCTISRKEEENLKASIIRLREICEAYDIETVALGLPLNLYGSEGKSAEKVRAFQKRLSRAVYPRQIVLVDERLTTQEADEMLKAKGIKSRSKRKETLDQLSAVLILESYLNERSQSKAEQKA